MIDPATEEMDTGAYLRPFATASLAARVADAIVDAIAGGELQPGQRLIETELAGALEVSRVPVREAVKTLEAQGIVRSSPHRGAHVVPLDDARIDRICEARLALERLALPGAVAAFIAVPARLRELDALVARMEGLTSSRAWLEVCKADLAFHRTFIVASGNDIVALLWEALARHVLIVFGREIRYERLAAKLGAHHRELRRLFAGGDMVGLAAELEKHIMRLRLGVAADGAGTLGN
ncbi:MAG: GntR family transcriptional regulator [Geminicoccaceae bacterium]